MRLYRTTGLDAEQFAELVELVKAELSEPWDKPTGRPRALNFVNAVAVTCAYVRQNIIEEVLGKCSG